MSGHWCDGCGHGLADPGEYVIHTHPCGVPMCHCPPVCRSCYLDALDHAHRDDTYTGNAYPTPQFQTLTLFKDHA